MLPRVVNVILGIWLMAAPSLLGFEGTVAAINGRTAGPVIAACAIVAMAEVTRGVRWANCILGQWLLLAPLVLHYASWAATTSDVLTGMFVILSSLPRGRVKEKYGGGWSRLRSGDKTPVE